MAPKSEMTSKLASGYSRIGLEKLFEAVDFTARQNFGEEHTSSFASARSISHGRPRLAGNHLGGFLATHSASGRIPVISV